MTVLQWKYYLWDYNRKHSKNWYYYIDIKKIILTLLSYIINTVSYAISLYYVHCFITKKENDFFEIY